MEVLVGGENTVTQVALAVGFDSLSAFAKRFAQTAGESPSALRARRHQARG
jgi:AraC-like DNA-binding protein